LHFFDEKEQKLGAWGSETEGGGVVGAWGLGLPAASYGNLEMSDALDRVLLASACAGH
jgi:hypothetical protein